MRVKLDQLGAGLKRTLAPVYLISGDEPLQLAEAADDVRKAARQAGYAIREVISIGKSQDKDEDEAESREDRGEDESKYSENKGKYTGNEWRQLTFEAGTLSIFSEKKLIDLRLPTAKPGSEGSKALIAYCKNLPEDSLLLITAGKLEKNAPKAQWFQAIDKVGVVVDVWPLQGEDLLRWLKARAQRRGMRFEDDAIKSLLLKIEGNLLAAAQEIEKLYILHGQAVIDRVVVEVDVADSARFNVFKLVDSLMLGRLNRAIKILHSLQAEGIVAPVVLWALCREARTLFNINAELKNGGHLENILNGNQIPDKRKQAFQDALARLNSNDLLNILQLGAKTDLRIKGQLAGDPWESLFDICLLYVKA